MLRRLCVVCLYCVGSGVGVWLFMILLYDSTDFTATGCLEVFGWRCVHFGFASDLVILVCFLIG